MKRFIFSCFIGMLLLGAALLGGCCIDQPTSETNPNPAQPKTYVVQSGDTFALIARRFGVTVSDLERVNASDDPTKLHIGQILQLPDNAQPPTLPQ